MESQRFPLKSKWSQVSQLLGGRTVALHNSRGHQCHHLIAAEVTLHLICYGNSTPQSCIHSDSELDL